jgi:hypothetical protein
MRHVVKPLAVSRAAAGADSAVRCGTERAAAGPQSAPPAPPAVHGRQQLCAAHRPRLLQHHVSRRRQVRLAAHCGQLHRKLHLQGVTSRLCLPIATQPTGPTTYGPGQPSPITAAQSSAAAAASITRASASPPPTPNAAPLSPTQASSWAWRQGNQMLPLFPGKQFMQLTIPSFNQPFTALRRAHRPRPIRGR